MKKTLANRLFSFVLCLCLLMSATNFDMPTAIAESPETVTTPTDVDEPSGEATEEPTEAPTPEAFFGDVNGDGQVTVDDLRQLLAEGLTLTEAQALMPLSVLNRAVGHDHFEVELWSDAQGTQRERLNHAEVVWRDIPTGVQCDDKLVYRVGNYPAIEGYAAQSLMLGDQYVTAMTLLAIGDDEYLYAETVRFENERKIEGYALLSAGEKLVIRYVAVAQEPEAEPTDESAPLPEEVLVVQALIDALPAAAELTAMDVEAQRAVYAQTQAAYEAYRGLTEEQQALIVGAEVFEALFDVFNGSTALLFSGGSGTASDPYLISNAEELASISSNRSSYFKLIQDITISGTWVPLCKPEALCFTGTLDGDGHMITYSGVSVNVGGDDAGGLFSFIGRGAVVKNLNLTGNLTFVGSNKGKSCGTFAGNMKGRIENCSSAVNVISSVTNSSRHTGGFVGYIENGTIINCYSTGSVTASFGNKGAFIAYANRGTIQNCYTTAGLGFVGYTLSSVSVSNSYSIYGGNNTTQKTEEQFRSGEVAWLLQNGQSAQVWGQTIGSDGAPRLTSNSARRVWRVTFTLNNSVIQTSYVNNGRTVTLPDATLPEGTYWNANGTAFTAETPVTQDCAVIASRRALFGSEGGTVTTIYGQAITQDLDAFMSYDENSVSPDNNFTYTLVDDQGIGATISGSTLSVPATVDAGRYALTVQATENASRFAALALNYGTDDVTFTVTLIVAKADPQVSVTANDRIYDGTAQALVQGSTTGGTLQYGTEQNGSYTTDVPTGTDAAAYTVWYKVVGDKNFNDVAADHVTVTIDRATLTADMFTFMPPADLIYDGRAKAATVTSMVEGVNGITVKYLADGELLTGAPTEVGHYTVRIDVTESTNYNAATDLTAADWAFDVRYLTAPDPAYTLTDEQYRSGNVLWVDEKHQVSIVPPTGYTISVTLGSGYADSLPVTAWTAGDSVYLRDAMGHMTDAVAVTESVRVDNAAPMGQIALENIGIWQMLLVSQTYGLFFREAKTVSIEANDDESGVAEVNWLLVTDALPEVTPEWLGSQDWQAFTGEAITLPKDGKYVVFAKVVDNVGHVTYISTDGIVIYSDAEALTETVTYTKTGTADVSAQVTLNGNTIAAVALNGSTLEPGVDYTVDGGTITFKASWLDALAEGQYTLTVSYDPQGVAYQSGAFNEEPATTQVTLTVLKAEPEVTPPEPKIGLVYDGTAQQLITAGSTSGGTMVYSLTENGAYAETIPVGTNAGIYQVWYKVVGNGSYAGTAADCVEVTIGKAEQAALTITNGPESVTYGDDPFTLLASGGSGEGAVTWAVTEGAAYASVDADGQVTVTGAGEVVITATKAADSNHKAAVTAAYAFTVERRALTASISGDTTKVYDGSTAAPEGLSITVTGLVFGDAVTASARDYAYDAAQAGQRVITATGIALDEGEKAANYALTADTATVDGEITARTIDIGVQTFTYDGGDTFTVDVDGVTLADGTVEAITVTLTTGSKDAGEYAPADFTAEWDDDNYAIIISSVTIEPLTAELAWSDELSFIYDGEPHGITAAVVNRQGDDVFALTYADNEATDAGEYTAVVTDLSNGNYVLPENARQAWVIMKAAQDEPVVKINFFAETLVPDGVVEYSLNGEDWLPCAPDMPVTDTGWDGTEPVVIYVRYAEDDNHEAGPAIELTIPVRPDAPKTNIELVKSRTAITLTENDALTGCEYAIDGGDWQPTGAFDGLTAGTEHTITYRFAATETSFASFISEISVTTVSDDGTTALQPGETVEAGGTTVTNDGDEIIITDEDGHETTITPAEGTTVGDDGTITVPEGAVIEDERFGSFTTPEGGGTYDPKTGVFTPANGAGKVSAKVQAGPGTPTIRIDMSDDALRDAALDAEDRRLVAWGWNVEIVLTVANIDDTIDARTLGLVMQAAGEYTIGRHLEITMSRTIGGETEAIHETTLPIRLVIDVPQPFENDEDRSYAVIRVHDGKAALLNDEDSTPDAITVSTDRFSTYSIVYRASATPTEAPSIKPTATPAPTTVPGSNPPKTGDDSMLWLWLALLLVSGVGMAATVIRMKSRKR